MRNPQAVMFVAMMFALPASAGAQSQAPAPVSSKLPPGVTFSVGVGGTSRDGSAGDTFERSRTAPVSGSVEVALNRFMLAQGEVLTWREAHRGTSSGFTMTGPLGAGYSGDFIHQSRERNTAIVGNFLGRVGAGRVYGTAGFGVGIVRQAYANSGHRTGCVPHFVGACNVPPYDYRGRTTSFTMQLLAGADVVLTPRVTAFVNVRSLGADRTMTTATGGVRWTVRRAPVGPGWRGVASPSAASAAIGKGVHVEAFDHSRQNGTLVSLTDTHVTIRNMAGVVTLPLGEVRGIRKQTHAILGSTLTGIGGGLATGLILCAAYGDCEDEGGWVVMLTMGIGAGVGGAVGAIYNLSTADRRTIYVNPRKSTMAFAPILGKKRAGAGARITW
jgi:hypothetical protein